MLLAKKNETRGDRTVQGQAIRDGELFVEYTDKALSGWGGLAVFFEFVEQTGFFRLLKQVFPEKKTSPNFVSSGDIVKALFATVLVGGNRFSHVERVREDQVIRNLIGAARMGSADTVRRLFLDLTRGESQAIYESLHTFSTKLLFHHVQEDVLDLDSTILERYGRQEGVAKGYHTSRAGQLSHHPLLGMFARSKHIVHLWLRCGGASTMRGAREFVDELMAGLPAGFRITAVRADSGFFTEDYLRAFEGKSLHYIMPIRMHPPMRRAAAAVPQTAWQRLDDEHEVADILHHAPNWAHPRRVLFVRREIHTDGKDQLFDVPQYEFSALVTSLSWPADECVQFYDQRGECENTIKEFKAEYGARGFCLNSFHATEAVFRLIATLFNLVSEFKRVVLKDTARTLGTIRNGLFVVGAMLGRRARQLILRLALDHQGRSRFDLLLDRIRTAPYPTAAQFISTA